MCDDNGKNFIATLYNVLLAPDLCNRLFSIIELMNAGYNFLFRKGFCTVLYDIFENYYIYNFMNSIVVLCQSDTSLYSGGFPKYTITIEASFLYCNK